jgi:DNA segregation ATPase FtsK/SpoIIIE, S-DNA-T family
MAIRTFSLRPTTPDDELTESAPSARQNRAPSIKRGLEAASLLLFALAVFVSLALATLRLDPYDPALSGRDWMGPTGAVVARVLVQGFGVVAWLAPLELTLLALPLLRGRWRSGLGLRVAGDLVVVIIASALVQVAAPEMAVFGRAPAGGNVGLLFGELMRALFSAPGSFLVGVTLVGLILIGRSSFSFILLCQRLAQLARRLGELLAARCRRLSAAWATARELRRERRDAALAAALPKIDEGMRDQAIIAQLEDDEADWMPVETTGPPPLALSEALRSGGPGAAEALLETEPAGQRRLPHSALSGELELDQSQLTDVPAEQTPSADLAECSSDAAAAVNNGDRRRAAKPAEPRIVNACPGKEVRRIAPKPERDKASGFQLPTSDLLEAPGPSTPQIDRARLFEHAQLLEKTLLDYGVTAKVEEIHPGPTVTTFEVAPQAGTKVSKVANLSDDLALALSRKVRIIAPIPGKSRIGFELPNEQRIPVSLRELVEDERFAKLAEKAPLPVVLGRDIVGAPFYADLASMPHVIVAGATGAGKSVGLNVMLSSLLFRRTPDDLRFLMVDPKVVELAPFDGIPHMLLPVVTDMKQAATALRWAVNEMERRYQMFANAGTKNISTYNNWVRRVASGELPVPDPAQVQALSPEGAVVSVPASKHGSDGLSLPGKLPYIVIVVDEFADLMMQQGKDVEACVARLAQKARAAGMHVVLATQRPSVDVITGMIKANFPSRIAFRVAQKVDSRTILDDQGAELLLGKGDALVKVNGSSDTRRVQCPFISEEEVTALTDRLRAQGKPEYHNAILEETDEAGGGSEEAEVVDSRFDEAVRIVGDTQRCSTSWLQRKMTIGYNRAAKIVEMMEKRGIVGPANGARDREVLIGPI